MKIGTMQHRLAYIAAALAALSVILAVISRLAGANIVVTPTSYINFATVAILFAIYFLIEGAASK
ncbi:MAG: hypothetical protein HYY41_00960 [Chloroflexi bacterium]|nr:hypothetical protein [Chloroflexota bacterium]